MFRTLCLAVIVVGTVSAGAQNPCQDQVCSLPPKIGNKQQCYKCIEDAGSTCKMLLSQACPTACGSNVCYPYSGDPGQPGGGGQSPVASSVAQCKSAAAQNIKLPTAQPGDLLMGAFPGTTDAPVLLVAVNHDLTKDFFASGQLLNVSTQKIVSYRIGWLMYPRDSKTPVEREGRLRKLKPPLAPGSAVNIPAQGADPNESNDGRHSRIVFYVAEVILADGTDWKPDLSPIEKKYAPQTK